MVHGGFPVLKGEMALLNTHLDSQGQPGLHDCCLLVMEIDSLCCGRQSFKLADLRTGIFFTSRECLLNWLFSVGLPIMISNPPFISLRVLIFSY